MNFVNTAKRLQSEITQTLDHDDLAAAGAKYDQLEALFQALKTATSEIKLIKLGSQTQIITRLRKLREDINILDQPTVTLEDIQMLQAKDTGIKEVAPGITLRTTVVPTEDFIPDSPLYYIRSTQEYAVKVQGVVIKGCIKNIQTGSMKTADCQTLGCTGCKWGHANDSSWAPGNFLFTREILAKKNLHMRHIGSRDTLKSDILAATRREKVVRSSQLAHDLLVQLCITKVTG